MCVTDATLGVVRARLRKAARLTRLSRDVRVEAVSVPSMCAVNDPSDGRWP